MLVYCQNLFCLKVRKNIPLIIALRPSHFPIFNKNSRVAVTVKFPKKVSQ